MTSKKKAASPTDSQEAMYPKPDSEMKNYKGSEKLLNKVAIVTGGDSGIGRAVAIAFAKEGADVVITYLKQDEDAENTKALIYKEERKCLTIAGDLGYETFCEQVINKTIDEFGKIDILVNNAAEQTPQKGIEDITKEQLEHTFRTNIFSQFYMVKHAIKHLKKGSAIINTTSVTAYQGNKDLIDYSSTKGAIVAFTYSLSESLIEKGIRVNGVAPGPIWTPLIPSTFPPEKVATFGQYTPMKRAGQPDEVAPSYVFLASDDSSYMSGQILHPNGGNIIHG